MSSLRSHSPTRMLALALLLGPACGGAQRAEPPKANPCGDAKPVAIEHGGRASVLARLPGSHHAALTLRCPSEAPCTLPADREIDVIIEPQRTQACSFAACKVSYLGSLPLELAGPDPCPSVLWSVVSVRLRSAGGTLDDEKLDVSVLASEDGRAYLRFMIESPGARARVLPPGDTRSLLLDVQLEVSGDRLRGQLSALAAPLPSGPASELRFAGIWSATWESPLASQ